jgi:hypothetical protein
MPVTLLLEAAIAAFKKAIKEFYPHRRLVPGSCAGIEPAKAVGAYLDGKRRLFSLVTTLDYPLRRTLKHL